jgi:hypothetical protein
MRILVAVAAWWGWKHKTVFPRGDATHVESWRGE